MSYFIATVINGETTETILETSTTATNIIELDTCYINDLDNITIERYQDYNLEIINSLVITVDDLPNNIPIDKIIGNFGVERITGLDDYLTMGLYFNGSLDINGNTIRLRSSRTISSSTAAGNTGEVCWDSNYLYICIATNTWRRISLGSSF